MCLNGFFCYCRWFSINKEYPIAFRPNFWSHLKFFQKFQSITIPWYLLRCNLYLSWLSISFYCNGMKICGNSFTMLIKFRYLMFNTIFFTLLTSKRTSLSSLKFLNISTLFFLIKFHSLTGSKIKNTEIFTIQELTTAI